MVESLGAKGRDRREADREKERSEKKAASAVFPIFTAPRQPGLACSGKHTGQRLKGRWGRADARCAPQNRRPCSAPAGRPGEGCEAQHGRQRARAPQGLRDGVAETAKRRRSAARWGGWGPRAGGDSGALLAPELRASAHRAPLLHFQPPEGPDRRSQGDLDSRAGAKDALSFAPTSRPQARREPEACGEAAARCSEKNPGGPGPGSARPGIRPPRNNGRRGCGGQGRRGGAAAPGRWKPRPSPGALTTRAGPHRLLPAPRRPAPGGAPDGALQPQPPLCRAGPGVGAGAPSLPPSPAAMSQGSPGDWAPLDPSPGPSAPPNPFVHELHLSRLQRVKVKCERGRREDSWGEKRRPFRAQAKMGMGIRKRGG